MKSRKEKIKELFPILSAYTAGKEIEWKWWWNDCWSLITNNSDYDFFSEESLKDNIEYRIKKEPEYVPYETVNEVIEASKKHGNFITKKPDCHDSTAYAISSINKHTVCLYSTDYPFSEMLDLYNWADDGTPFGKLKE